MHLRDITMSDLPLYSAMLTDPAVMAELGGPLPRVGLAHKLRAIVDDVRTDRAWYDVIVPGTADGLGAGTVCVWDHEEDGEPITEIGWMVLPSFQRRGLATAAVTAILERARADGRWRAIHAFPGISNGASNAICRKNGFERREQREIVYVGRTLRCHRWVLEL